MFKRIIFLFTIFSIPFVCEAFPYDEKATFWPHQKLGTLNTTWNVVQDALDSRFNWVQARQDQEKYNVIIIGAGMAGLATVAELTAIDPTVIYIILESTNWIRGHVQSVNFGATGQQVKIEDGANWLYDDNGLPTWQLANELGLQKFENDYQNFTIL